MVAQQKIIRQLRRVGAKAADVTLEVRPGRAAKELLAVASKQRAMMIVLGDGEHGAGAGQVAKRVIQGSRTPVVIVPRAVPAQPKRNAQLHLVPKAKAR